MPFPDEFKYKEKIFSYVENYTNIKERCQLSSATEVFNLHWRLLLTPAKESCNGFGYFLHCSNENDPNSNWSCYAEADLEIMPQNENGVAFSRNIRHMFVKNCFHWGFTNFISLRKLLDVRNVYVKNDKIIFKLRLKVYKPRSYSAVLKSSLPSIKSDSVQNNDVDTKNFIKEHEGETFSGNYTRYNVQVKNSNKANMDTANMKLNSLKREYNMLEQFCEDLKQKFETSINEKAAAESKIKILEEEMNVNDNRISSLEDKLLKLQFENTCLKEFQEMIEKKCLLLEETHEKKIKKLQILLKEEKEKCHLYNKLNLNFQRKIKELQVKNESDALALDRYRKEIKSLKQEINKDNVKKYEYIYSHMQTAEKQNSCKTGKDEFDLSPDSSDYGSDSDEKLQASISKALKIADTI